MKADCAQAVAEAIEQVTENTDAVSEVVDGVEAAAN